MGAGVLGLTCALKLARHGADVTVYEADPDRPNASSVAAGMIAPATECGFEPALTEIACFLAAARDNWNALASELGIALRETGAVHVGSAAAIAARGEQLEALGFQVAAASPFGDAEAAVFLPQDALIAPGPALAALRAAVVAAGGALRTGQVVRAAGGLAVDDRPLDVNAVVLATGAPGRTGGLAPELALLRPIKGQLLRWLGLGEDRPILRQGPSFYLTSQPEEIVAGATMEDGRDDLAPELEALMGPRAQAERLIPALCDRDPEVRVGVRADTPDGLPLVGPSRLPGVFLATGARRNGWLFAPPVASIIAAQVLGLPLGPLAPLAERLHPGRFDRSEAT